MGSQRVTPLSNHVHMHTQFLPSLGFLVAQRIRIHLPVQEIRVRLLVQEDPLEREMVTHSTVFAWEIPQTEKPSGLQSTRLQRVEHDLWTKQQQIFTKIFILTIPKIRISNPFFLKLRCIRDSPHYCSIRLSVRSSIANLYTTKLFSKAEPLHIFSISAGDSIG